MNDQKQTLIPPIHALLHHVPRNEREAEENKLLQQVEPFIYKHRDAWLSFTELVFFYRKALAEDEALQRLFCSEDNR